MALTLLTVASCAGSINSVPYTWEGGLPHFEWVEPAVFQQNLENCRRQTFCKADSLFDK